MITIHHGDCLDVLRTLADNSVDSVVTDPPYGLSFMGKRWDYDVPSVDVWRECLRVLKPGGHLLAFAGTRTQHRMAVRIEDAGFEIRDMIAWVYATGFPKSLDVAKAIGDKDAARQWQGWGTALKPALEPITVARKPLDGTVAETVLRWGTGGINVDGCRVKAVAGDEPLKWEHGRGMGFHGAENRGPCAAGTSSGRFPANLIHDGSDEVVGLFPVTGPAKSGGKSGSNANPMSWTEDNAGRARGGHDDAGGSAARYFYCAKASKADRDDGCDHLPARTAGEVTGGREEGSAGIQSPRAGAGRRRDATHNHHPTVKPTDLMRYLCRLVTPPGGTVLDPFVGSGSTGRGAVLEGFAFIGVEREAEYIGIAKARIAAVAPEPEPEAQPQITGQLTLF